MRADLSHSRIPIHELWVSNDASQWNAALQRYWELVKPEKVPIERAMERFDRQCIRQMSAEEWFSFLRDDYFRWKYTAPNRYATTTAALNRKCATQDGRNALDQIRGQILDLRPEQIRESLKIVSRIPGLGIAGASGLLAILYPEEFGTVDQFVVKALREVSSLPEASAINCMNPESLKLTDGEVLIEIMRRHANFLTKALSQIWRPRDVDKVLWTYGRKERPTDGAGKRPAAKCLLDLRRPPSPQF